MASFGSKKDIQKRDMNFFAEFTAAAARTTRLLTYGVIALVVIVALVVVFVAYCIVRNAIIKSEINKISTELASEEYANLEAEAANLSQDLARKNNYFYALSQMRNQVEMATEVPLELPDIIADSIPSDSYVEGYSVADSVLKINGYSFSYYSITELVNMLDEQKVFSVPPVVTIKRVAPNSVGKEEDFVKNAINNYYTFEITGTVARDLLISIGSYVTDGETIVSLGAIQTQEVAAGEAYSIPDIATIQYNGNTYNLSNITVDGSSLTEEDISNVISRNELTGIALSDSEISLYYVVAESAETDAAEGEA